MEKKIRGGDAIKPFRSIVDQLFQDLAIYLSCATVKSVLCSRCNKC